MNVRARYDGKVLIPDHPLDLPADSDVEIEVRAVARGNGDEAAEPAGEGDDRPLMRLLEGIPGVPIQDDDLPTDLAAEHDHYLYGTPKKNE
jgi:hypothetical protein